MLRITESVSRLVLGEYVHLSCVNTLDKRAQRQVHRRVRLPQRLKNLSLRSRGQYVIILGRLVTGSQTALIKGISKLLLTVLNR